MKFEISRLNTSIGIFKLSGEFSDSSDIIMVNYSSAEFMGSDGWVAINIDSQAGLLLLNKIPTDVIKHLTA
ncbi:hypothetical protein [Vibrio algarum]|uniref:Uncharacterized protein n=1 Tax=Vibrio algarum TaxID=3020714 RepID=A0ABT4YVP6_9VIBR|nr:hypothetical protein [Vibrio sp. KJ40-1]MDB1125084.1 hypothetical protein [Vibrio sp. KJ40-1]